MKHILLVVDSGTKTKFMLEKAMRFFPDKITVLLFAATNQKNHPDALRAEVDLVVANLCETSIVLASTDSTAQRVEILSETLDNNEIDMTILHRPHLGQASLDFSLIKAVLRAEINSTVFLCGDTRWRTPIKLLGTLDIFDDSPAQEALNNKVLNLVADLSNKLKAKVKVLSVIPIARIKEEFDITDEDEVLAKEGKPAKAKLESIVEQTNMFSAVSVQIAAGSPSSEIASVSSKMKASLVIIGNVGRTGIKGLFVGNTAEKILNRLSVDALIVRH